MLLFRSVAVAVTKFIPSTGHSPTKVNVPTSAKFVRTNTRPRNTRPEGPLVLLAEVDCERRIRRARDAPRDPHEQRIHVDGSQDGGRLVQVGACPQMDAQQGVAVDRIGDDAVIGPGGDEHAVLVHRRS